MSRAPSKKSLPVLEPSQTEWRIEKLVPGGAGFLRLANGQSAFAPGALPGERVRVSEAVDHGAYLQATRWSLLEASPDRLEPICPVQSRCGGCDLMTLSYSAQLLAKAGILRDALTRAGRFDVSFEIPFVASEEPLQYRSRIRLHVGGDGRLGFFAAGSHDLIEIPGCLVAHPEIDAALLRLRSIARERRAELALFSELELRVAPAGPRLSLQLIPRAGRLERAAGLIAELGGSFLVQIAGSASDPEQDQRFPLPGGTTLRAPAATFTQVNWAVNQRLVQALLDRAQERRAESFCDLYCGSGNFSLPLFARGLTGIGIEASQEAIAAAKRAATEHGFEAARFVSGDVRDRLAKLARAERFDLIVLDPPRSGAREILPELIERAPHDIAYVACDPVTLARDLRTLCNGGYVLRHVTGFDMFPQTHHFETLAWLTRAA